MDASKYPVTFGYLAKTTINGVPYTHRGEDRACLEGTPIIINGVTIGLTGNTGKSTGAHLHLQCGRDMYAQQTIKPTDYWFKGTEVVRTGTASEWGNYIIVKYKDVYCVYAHLSKILIKEGVIPMASVGAKRIAWSEVLGRDYTKTHKGDFDTGITENIGSLEYDKWVESKLWPSAEAKAFRTKRNAALKYYDQKPIHDMERQALEDAKATIENLSQRPTKAEYQEMEAKLTGIIADLEAAQAETPTESEVVKSWFRKLWERIWNGLFN